MNFKVLFELINVCGKKVVNKFIKRAGECNRTKSLYRMSTQLFESQFDNYYSIRIDCESGQGFTIRLVLIFCNLSHYTGTFKDFRPDCNLCFICVIVL